jgi:hypothetical protein
MIHPHLLYCINIFSSTSQANINRIATLQKKAIRIIFKEKANAHTSPLFKEAGILPFEKLILQARLNFMHSIEYKYAPPPPPLEPHSKRTTPEILTTTYAIQMTLLSPLLELMLLNVYLCMYTFPNAWNNEIGDLRFQHNKITFQIALKDHLLQQL